MQCSQHNGLLAAHPLGGQGLGLALSHPQTPTGREWRVRALGGLAPHGSPGQILGQGPSFSVAAAGWGNFRCTPKPPASLGCCPRTDVLTQNLRRATKIQSPGCPLSAPVLPLTGEVSVPGSAQSKHSDLAGFRRPHWTRSDQGLPPGECSAHPSVSDTGDAPNRKASSRTGQGWVSSGESGSTRGRGVDQVHLPTSPAWGAAHPVSSSSLRVILLPPLPPPGAGSSATQGPNTQPQALRW